MISGTPSIHQATLPNGEKVDPKNIGAKVQGMFLEMMLKNMEDSIGAEDGLFGNSSSAEIYRGMLREHLADALSSQLKSPFDTLIENKLNEAMPSGAALPAVPLASGPPTGSEGTPLRGRLTAGRSPHAFGGGNPTGDFSLKSNSGSSDKSSGKVIHQPAKDGPGAPNE